LASNQARLLFFFRSDRNFMVAGVTRGGGPASVERFFMRGTYRLPGFFPRLGLLAAQFSKPWKPADFQVEGRAGGG
jgi:hypothetical protein